MAREDLRSGDDVRDDVLSAPGPPDVRRDRTQHGGSTDRFDDDALAARTEQERVDTGLADYAPSAVPPATDDPVPVDFTATEEYRAGRDQVDREVERGLIATEGERPAFPPSRYPDS